MQLIKKMSGVTLLEIMLVLAIAAMIIVMSTRYYQSAIASQQANDTLQMIQAITATADGIAASALTYSSVTTSAIRPMMPNSSMATPWGGGDIEITGGAMRYRVTFPKMPGSVCSQVGPKLAANNKYTNVSQCAGPNANASFSYEYGY